ncbi:uncharacterized protein DS421_1g01450 [Arachis hypogaea]|nr:uncharacterized protein DS421_1g01450 [Arachis hypogaea]
MRENKMKNLKMNEFYIYFDHPVNNPEIVDTTGKESDRPVDIDDALEGLHTSSFSDNGYENTKDLLYKPPPPGFEDDSDSSNNNGGDQNAKRKKALKGKKWCLQRK